MKNTKGIMERMAEGEFLVSVQIDPPGAGKFTEFQDMIACLKEAGVTLVDINSSRRISHDSIQLGIALSQTGFEVIPHITTRDSSINGLLNQVFAAYEWAELRNFLVITGDPYEEHQSVVPSQGVFQTDSIGALRAFDMRLRRDQRFNLPILFAAAVNQNEPDIVEEHKRLHAKREVADFFMSQPVFTEKQADTLFRFYCANSARPLLVGVWPLINARTIHVIHEGRVAGVMLAHEEYEEAERIKTDESALHIWGIKKAEELIAYIKRSGHAQGVYVVAPARNPRSILPFLKEILSMCQK